MNTSLQISIKNLLSELNKESFYFISASNFNLMMMSEWLEQWVNINFIDCYDNNNNSIILAEYTQLPSFENIEGINAFLLGNKKIVEQIKEQKNKSQNKPRALFLFYDKELETMVDSLGMELIMPANKLVKHIDNKITTTEIGNSVNVPSVPNALVSIDSYQQLLSVISENKLSNEVVVQTAYGDSGKTTFFIASEDDYQKVHEQIEQEEKVKVMSKINCLQVAIEACATKSGTFIGPILTELIGAKELTPYKGGWCGNDVNPNAFSQEVQKTIYKNTEKLGNVLYQQGYRGYFEVDYLIDAKTDEVYLGEINPRVTGITALTNMSGFCNDQLPLFLFHLLEYSNIENTINTDEFNNLVMQTEHKPFGQLIFKSTDKELKILQQTLKSGCYEIKNNRLIYADYQNSPKTMKAEQIYVLRIMQEGEYVYKGADLVIVFANQLMQDKNQNLSDYGRTLIKLIQQQVITRDLSDEEKQFNERFSSANVNVVKSMA